MERSDLFIGQENIMPPVFLQIESLQEKKTRTATEELAYQRQIAAVKQGVPLIFDLTEPFHNHPKAGETAELCACLHLYARILDDAVDEALPIHRLNLLKIQPIFWDTTVRLSLLFPEKKQAMSDLIHETLASVLQEWQNRGIKTWGAKNHHLLMAPLVLSPDPEFFENHKLFLSDFLFLLQAKEEAGDFLDRKVKYRLMEKAEKMLCPEWMEKLYHAGWKTIAQQIPHELGQVLSLL